MRFLHNATGYWRVRAISGNEAGPYSETWSFTTNAGEDNTNIVLTAPILIAPTNGATIAPANVSFFVECSQRGG